MSLTGAPQRAARCTEILVCLFLFLITLKGQAQVFGINYIWTNALGGNWNTAVNWTPNGVPGGNAGDSATIGIPGNYTVTLNSSVTIGGLTLGFISGTQTLSITGAGTTFTVTGDAEINTNGVLSFTGAYLNLPTNTVDSGVINWKAGTLDLFVTNSSLIVASNGVLNLTTSAAKVSYASIINYGLTTWTNTGDFSWNGSSIPPVTISNRNGAIFMVQNDQTLSYLSGTPSPAAGFYNDNGAWFIKMTGKTNSATSIQVPFHNSGTIQPLTGNLLFSGGLSLLSSSLLQFLIASTPPGMISLVTPRTGTNSQPPLPTPTSPSSVRLSGTLEVDVSQAGGPIPNLGRPVPLMTFDSKQGAFDSVVLGAVSNGSLQVQLPTYPGSILGVIRTNVQASQFPSNMADINISVGGKAIFTPPAFGVLPLSYQWQSNGIPLTAETNINLVINNAQINDAANYCVTVTDAFNQTHTFCATLSVFAPLSFNTQPPSLVASNGTVVILSASVSSPLPVTYQWRRNAANILGATSATYVVTSNAVPWDGGSYDVLVSMLDPLSSLPLNTIVSTAAVVTVISPPLPFGDFPGGITNATSFIGSGTITNTNSIYLQWIAPSNYDGLMEFDTMGSSLDTVVTVGTGTNPTNAVTLASDDDSSRSLASRLLINVTHNTTYVVGVGGFAGATGPVVLSGAFVTNGFVPFIDTQPLSQGVLAGGTAVFSVSATNTFNAAYQWSKGGLLKIAGATNSTLVISNVGPADVNTYSATVTGGTNGQSVDSLRATLEIGPSLSFGKLGLLLQQYEQQTGNMGFSLRRVHTSSQTVAFQSVSAGSINSQLMNNFSSTTAPSDPTNLIASGGSPRWFMLTAATNATMRLDTLGSDLPTTFLGVYIPHGLFQYTYTLVASDITSAPDGIHSQVAFPAISNTTYLIEVDGLAGDQGTNIYLNWKMGVAPNTLGAAPSDVLTPGSGLPMLTAGQSNTVTSPGYQWQCNGTNIPGATASTYQLSGYQCGSYTVVVSNLVGVVTDAVALVYVDTPLQLQLATLQPAEARLVASAPQKAVLLLSTSIANPVWTPIYTNSIPLLPINYLDTDSTNRNKGFYRLKPWP